jgi:MFS family permease
MQEISNLVGYLNAIGPFTELLVSSVVGVICTKLGHRLPFLFGSVVQIAGSLVFLLAPNTALLFVARVTCSVANMFCAVSALLLCTIVFKDATERAKVLMYVFSSSFPVAAMLTYLLGNTAYSFFGPRIPFAMLFAMGLIDGLLRLIIKADDSDENVLKEESGEKPSETTPVCSKLRKGTYYGFLTNSYFLLTILMMSLSGFAFATTNATAPNWMINVLQAQQWQLGVVVGVSSAVHLISNLICGVIVQKQWVWVFLIWSCVSMSLGLVVYPLSPGIWYTIAPDILVRTAFGIMQGMTSIFISIIAETIFYGGTAKAFSLLTASVVLGCGLGSLIGGISLKYVSLMTIYYTIAACVFIAGFGALHQRTLVVN